MKVKEINEQKVSGMPPSYRNPYGAIENGYDLELHVVNHCNLNCAGCNHFAPLAEPWFLSIEEATEYAKLISERLPKVRRLLLLGGEPLLHPQLLEICKIFKTAIPKLHIEILSNGLLIDSISEEQKKEYCDHNIIFSFTPYPKNQLTEINSDKNLYGHFMASRLIFQETLVNVNGIERQDQFLDCFKSKSPCFTMKDFKIYICPFCAYVDNFAKKFNVKIDEDETDYLDMYTVTEKDLVNFCKTPKNRCKYCVERLNNHVWIQSDKSYEEYTTPIDDLYFVNYDRYEEIMNNNNFVHSILDNPFYYNRIDRNFCVYNLKKIEARYLNSKIDIIIPYYEVKEEIIYQLSNTLLQQSFINDCTIYFISDNSPNERAVFDHFKNIKRLNCVFLKNKENLGPGAARNKGIKNAQGKYLFFLDFDDTFVGTNGLERMYLEAEEKKADFLCCKMLERKRDGSLGPNNGLKILVSRELIQNNNLLYPELYIHEDGLFLDLLRRHTKNMMEYNDSFYVYERESNSPYNIGFINDSYIQKMCIAYGYLGYILQNNLIEDNKEFIEILNRLSLCIFDNSFCALPNQERINILTVLSESFNPLKKQLKDNKILDYLEQPLQIFLSAFIDRQDTFILKNDLKNNKSLKVAKNYFQMFLT